jgi:hypothetical protein
MFAIVGGVLFVLVVLGLVRTALRQRRDPRRGLANLGVVSTQWLQGHREEP